jgi:hypothetical protein
VYNGRAVDLYSARATQLRADVYEAHEAMIKAHRDFRDAIAIAQDCRNPDGTYGQRQAAERYNVASDAYRKALTAWVQHVLNS